MRILITGAAGYVGSALAQFLIQRSRYDIALIDNYSVPSSITEIEGTRIIHQDICDPKFNVSEYDIVVHCAAISGIKDCDCDEVKAVLNNVKGTYNLLRTCKGKFIFPSTSAVYGQAQETHITEKHPLEPRNHYGKTKLYAESIVALHHDFVTLRFSNIYGKGMTFKRTVADLFIESALKGEPLTIHGTGEQRRDFVHIKDVLVAYWRAINCLPGTNCVCNIGGNEALSINDIAELVAKSCRMRLDMNVEVKHIVSDCGVSWKDFTYSSEKAKEILGYEPIYSVGMEIKERLNVDCGPVFSGK